MVGRLVLGHTALVWVGGWGRIWTGWDWVFGGRLGRIGLGVGGDSSGLLAGVGG